jgi:hypothetical protein
MKGEVLLLFLNMGNIYVSMHPCYTVKRWQFLPKYKQQATCVAISYLSARERPTDRNITRKLGWGWASPYREHASSDSDGTVDREVACGVACGHANSGVRRPGRHLIQQSLSPSHRVPCARRSLAGSLPDGSRMMALSRVRPLLPCVGCSPGQSPSNSTSSARLRRTGVSTGTWHCPRAVTSGSKSKMRCYLYLCQNQFHIYIYIYITHRR